MDLRRIIRERLDELGMTQLALADRTGIHPVRINAFLRGHRGIIPSSTFFIAKAFCEAVMKDAFGVTMVQCDTDCTATSSAGGGETDGESGGPPPGRGNGKFRSGQVPFGLEVAAEARDAHRGSLMDNPDVVGTGLSFDENGEPVIQVYTLGARRSAGHAIPNELDGVKVQVIVTGAFRAY